MEKKLYYGFLDESGFLESGAGLGRFFIISVIVVAQPQELKHIFSNARNKACGKFQTHKVFKANKEDKGFVRLVLQELAKKDVEIFISIRDKKLAKKEIDKNIFYAHLVSQATNLVLSVHPRLELVLHKRYTLPRIRNQIDTIINQKVAKGTFLSLSHQTEIERKELEIADAVAWAVFQKYNNKKEEFYAIIKNKIIKENRTTA